MSLGFQSGNVFLASELLLAELIFLYPAPRRPHFTIRLFLALGLACLLAAYLPWLDLPGADVRPFLLRTLLVFAITVAAMFAVFQLPLRAVCALCVSGYATQHIAFRAHLLLAATPLGVLPARALELISIAIVYGLVFTTFGRLSARHGYYRLLDTRMELLSVVMALICLVMTRLPRLFGEDPNGLTACVYAIVCCLLTLFLKFYFQQMATLAHERTFLEYLRQEERKQYETSRSNIESLHICLHDLKHKLAGYQGTLPPSEIETLAREIDRYDSMLHTGNEALDVLLNEKNRRCQEKGIRLTCAGDGACLSFMQPVDIYSLFGNAVDNAIEAVEHLESEKRLIDIGMERRGDCVFLSFRNYFHGTLEMVDGLPQTTKTYERGYHGYGLKSMHRLAAQYEGDISVAIQGQMFHLNVYLYDPGTSRSYTRM